MAFWDAWETWAKMTFILACSIAAVFVFSFGIRLRNKRRIKKHSRRTTADVAEQGEMVQTPGQEEGIPFGIRAIESGCEVDGVWNSKTNTPMQTPGNSNPGSPLMRPKDLGNGLLSLQKHRRNLSLSTMSNLEINETDRSERESKTVPDNSTDTTSEAKSSSEQETAGEASPDGQLSMRGRRAYQPKSSTRKQSYPPSAYPAPSSSRCISYPPTAYQQRTPSRHRSYPPSSWFAPHRDDSK